MKTANITNKTQEKKMKRKYRCHLCDVVMQDAEPQVH